MKALRLKNDDQMPMVGLGTWKMEPSDAYSAVKAAVSVGYRHIDCAPAYGNEPEIGTALAECFAEGAVAREDMWVTSKLWNDAHQPEDVRPAIEQTLSALRLDYLDLFLIHWPVALRKGTALPQSGEDFIALDDLPISTTWEGIEAVHRAGLCRHVGVANFSDTKLASLLEDASVGPEVNQVELHPYLQQPELVGFCRDHGVHVTAYSSLGSGDRPEFFKSEDEPIPLADPMVAAIAERLGATPAQILLAWAIHRDIAVIPKSVNPIRMKENLAALDVELSPQDVEDLESLDRGRRLITGSFLTVPGSPYTFANLWDV